MQNEGECGIVEVQRGDIMKAAIIGSRTLKVKDIKKYLPDGVDCIVSGGAAGVDTSAAEFAKKAGISLELHLPDYGKWGRRAPLMRNLDIVAAADVVLAFWDGKSRGTEFVIDHCRKQGKPLRIFLPDAQNRGEFLLQKEATQLKFE